MKKEEAKKRVFKGTLLEKADAFVDCWWDKNGCGNGKE